jgi:Predicted hydrolase of the alpha/beta-hydrolase fold
MIQKAYTLAVSESSGNVSAELIAGERTDVIMTFAHGAGAGMNHLFMTSLAKELADRNIATLRFNFPYMEHKKGRPDVPAVAHKAVAAAIQKAHELFPKAPVFVSGKSFGGRMSSQYLSTHSPDFVKGLIFFGFPLHAAGKPSVDRAEHLKNVKVPLLFLQGTRDALAIWDMITAVTNELSLATLHKLEGADHSFKAGKQNLIPVLAEVTAEWIKGKIKKG